MQFQNTLIEHMSNEKLQLLNELAEVELLLCYWKTFLIVLEDSTTPVYRVLSQRSMQPRQNVTASHCFLTASISCMESEMQKLEHTRKSPPLICQQKSKKHFGVRSTIPRLGYGSIGQLAAR